MSKTQRIELRMSAEDTDVQARPDRTLMSAEQFDALGAALDVADDTPNLAQEFARPRRFVQR